MDPDEPAPGIGSRIATLREVRGFDQKEFSAVTGKSVRTIQAWESERATPPRREVAKLGRLLGVDSGWIWTAIGTPPAWAGADERQDARELLGLFLRTVESPSEEAVAQLKRLLPSGQPRPETLDGDVGSKDD